MSPAFARAVDDATVRLLERTSWRLPSDHLVDCPACGCPFWADGRGGTVHRYCGRPCRQRAYWRRRSAGRAA